MRDEIEGWLTPCHSDNPNAPTYKGKVRIDPSLVPFILNGDLLELGVWPVPDVDYAFTVRISQPWVSGASKKNDASEEGVEFVDGEE
jgi:hypothetical protein